MKNKAFAVAIVSVALLIGACGSKATFDDPEEGRGDIIEEEADWDEEPMEGAPIVEDGRFIDDDVIDDLSVAGEYKGITYSSCVVSMYTDVDEYAAEVGNVLIIDDAGKTVCEGVLIKVMDNYYEISGTDFTISSYTDNETICLDLFEGNNNADYFVMVTPFIS